MRAGGRLLAPAGAAVEGAARRRQRGLRLSRPEIQRVRAAAPTCPRRRPSIRRPACAPIPVVERHRFVWLWMGDPALADPALVPDMHWNDDPAWAGDGKTIHVKCDYRLVVDNLMDLTHEAFVHGSSIGNDAVAEAPFDVTHGDSTVTVTRWMRGIDAPPFWADAAAASRAPVDRWQIIRFEAPVHGQYRRRRGARPAPARRRATALAGRQRLRAQHHDAGDRRRPATTSGPSCATTACTEQQLTTEIRDGVAGIFHEDEIILEAQQRAMNENPDRTFYNLNIDAGAMWARRVIDRMVARENRAADRCRRRSERSMSERDAERSVSQNRARATRAARHDPVRRGCARASASASCRRSRSPACRGRRCGWRWCGSRMKACCRRSLRAASW